LELTDFLASVDIVYLGRAIAACRNVLAILAEADTTYDTFVQEIVKELDIKNSSQIRVEHSEPITSYTLLFRRQVIRVQVGQFVANSLRRIETATWRSGARYLRRCSSIGIGYWLSLLRGGRSGSGTVDTSVFAQSGRVYRLGWLGAVAIQCRTGLIARE
jgi:hypothetical protein